MKRLPVLLGLVAMTAAACTSSSESSTNDSDATGWVGDTSFEVGATITSRVEQPAQGDWADLATSTELQTTLVDTQWKFAKNRLKAAGYDLNQLADSVTITKTETSGGVVTLTYEAKVDLLREIATNARAPKLEEISPRAVALKLPLRPVGAFAVARGTCSDHHDGEPDGDRNFYYHWDENDNCTLPMVDVSLTVTEVFPRTTVYPEYDQLLTENIGGKKGFRAALVPATGDYDPMSRFDAHRDMLEDLGLVGKATEDGKATRYTYVKGDVAIEIDLFDPTKAGLTPQFRAALSSYQLVFFNGHSVYGTRDFLTDETSFSSRYQILMMHSCRSYPYYTRQVFRAKATSEDPTGWEGADVVATGESSYPTDSPRTLRPLLEGLVDGMSKAKNAGGAGAPSWNALVKKMNDRTSGILYGVAGVRTNTWKPR